MHFTVDIISFWVYNIYCKYTQENLKMKKLLSIALIAVLAFSLVACSSDKTEDTNTDKKVLTVATSADFPPYEFVDDDGNFAGIDVEIAGLIADKMGYELEIVNMDFNSIIPAVATGKYDLGMSGFSITEDRKESVLFSDCYVTAQQVVIVTEDSDIESVDDLYAEGATYVVGTQLSTTGDIYFSDDIANELTTCSIMEYVKATDLVQALKTGKIDCIIIDNAPAQEFVAKNEGLKILETEYLTEEYAVCTKLGNDEMISQVNAALSDLLSEGSIQAVIDKYISAK